MNKIFCILIAIIAVALFLLIASCCPQKWDCLNCKAQRVSGTLTECSRFDAPAWQQAETYPLQSANVDGPAVREEGKVKFIHHDDYLLCLADLSDSNVIQHNNLGSPVLFTSGDVLEIFLQAENQQCYWELHFGPDGQIRAFLFYVSGGKYEQVKLDGLKTEVKLDGTLNQGADRDMGWRMLAVIPLAELYRRGSTITGIPLPSKKVPARWKLMVGRYNYLDLNLKTKELSQIVKATGKPNFHRQKSWVTLNMTD